MGRGNRQILKSYAYAAAVIAAAVVCRAAALSTENAFLDRLANFTRIYLYLGLFVLWGASVTRRVLQSRVRRYLIAVAVLMILWLTLREFRWHLVEDGDVKRWLWYAYYLAILPIPVLALHISLSLGQPQTYRPPKWTALLYLPTFLLIALVLTNDLHQRVFVFPDSASLYTALDYRYGPGFAAVFAWAAGCAFAAFCLMLVKCRIPRTRNFLWLPLIPFGIAMLYVACYAARIPLVTGPLGDLAVFDCLVATAFFESCIQCGLIPSNTRYAELFRASAGISMQIADEQYVVRYAAKDAASFFEDAMRRAEQAPVLLEDGKRLHNMRVNGGHAVWAEDLSELLDVQEKLASRREELRDRNAFLQYEYEQEKAHRPVVEQNRLFDLLQDKTQPQLDRIRQLTEEYGKGESEEEKRRILAHIVVLGSYIKRRKDFALSIDASPLLPESKLTSALEESFRSLALLGIRGGFLVRTGRDVLDGEVLARAYDFIEAVAESVLDHANYLNAAVSPAGGVLRCTVTADCRVEEDVLMREFQGMQVVTDEDGSTVCLLPLEGGEVL